MIGGGGHGNSVARWSTRWALVRWPSGQLPEPRWLAAHHALVSKVVEGPSATLHLHWQTCRITNKPNHHSEAAVMTSSILKIYGFNLHQSRGFMLVCSIFLSKRNSNRFARSSPVAGGKARAMMAEPPLLNAHSTAQPVAACTSSLCRPLQALHETPHPLLYHHFSLVHVDISQLVFHYNTCSKLHYLQKVD